MLLHVLGCLLLFLITTLGLAWPLAARLGLPPAEKLVASAALSLLSVFFAAWAIYVFALPLSLLWTLPAFAPAALVIERRTLVEAWRDPPVREIALAQLLVTGWCVGWLSLVSSYSGGGWTGDWFEHWQRARFFLEQGPLDQKFLAISSLTARPPLANVVTGAFLALTRVDFAHYQLVTTLLSSLVFLPAALLARYFLVRPGIGERSAVAVLAVLVMLNPLVLQNATFAWTKLPSAFFVLAGLYFFLRMHSQATPVLATASLSGVCLAAGMLAHYSAGPYLVVLALVWLTLGWRVRYDATWRRTTLVLALSGTLVLATWFGWSLAIYGADGTLLSNSSVTAADTHAETQFTKIILNLRDTFVPHFLRPLDTTLIAQTSPWGWWRDWFFQIYQLNFFFAFGSVAWLALLLTLARGWREAGRPVRWIWSASILLLVLLGVGVHGARDTWGLTHICLQPLVLLGLALLAARWSSLGRGWRLALVAGATVDFILGIALHFGVQNYALDRWLTPQRPPVDWFYSYNESAMMNLIGKVRHSLVFFGEALGLPLTATLLGLALLLATALRRAR